MAAVVIFRPTGPSNPPGQGRAAFQTGGGTFLMDCSSSLRGASDKIQCDAETKRAVSRPHREPRDCCSQLQSDPTAINFFQMGETKIQTGEWTGREK